MTKYQSYYSPNKEVTAAQFICELLCKNRAEYLKIVLPFQFWKLEEWATFYKVQLKKCHECLSSYHENIVIKVIKKKKIYSLYPQWIYDCFDEENKKTLAFTKNIEDIKPVRILNSKGKENKDLELGYLD